MTEKFRNVETFHVPNGMAYLDRQHPDELVFELDCEALNVDQARALRDWLIAALPAETEGKSNG